LRVIGQAFPHTPIANPAWMFPDWEFGIKEEKARRPRAGRAGSGRGPGCAAVA
jgi:sulfur-oxidizing protein SoxB